VQLTLGKAEIKTNFKENIKLYNDAIRDYEEQLVSDLEIEDALLEKEWIEDSIAYEEEMNALAIELAKEDEKEWEKFEQKRGEFKESLRAFKAKVEEKNKKFKDGLEESFEDVAEHYGELGQYYYMY
jgi:chromosome segregation ATPase